MPADPPSDLLAALRGLPRVDALADALADGGATHVARVGAARAALAEVRAAVRSAGAIPELAAIVALARAHLAVRRRARLRPVLNATGVVIHTNLGRAPLPVGAVADAAGYVALEYDLAAGARGSRRGLVEPLLLELFAAPPGSAALVANNNAAAVMLALASLVEAAAGRREVIVSRGELVEIGGSFRVPDVLATSGATLVEVGTTNRTRADDYARAVTPRTAALLRVHPSNYRITGFVARPTVAELAAVARAAGVPLVIDLGSDAPGALPAALVPDAERAADALADGADLVCFSGDKLLGGPQCGLAIGRAAHVERMARHPLMRALRPDKLALGALDVVLRAYADGEPERVPVYQMVHTAADVLRARATRLADALAARLQASQHAGVWKVEPIETADPIGGGSHPDVTLPGWAVAIPDAPSSLAAALRQGDPPVIAVTHGGALILALRTVPAEQDEILAAAVHRALDTLDPPR